MNDYPCLLKLEGDDELIFIASKEALDSECGSLILDAEDYLVDINGYTYAINQSGSGLITAEKLGSTISIGELTELIQAHQFAKADVCLTKIRFASIRAAIYSLVSER